jgi:hypothetical protein
MVPFPKILPRKSLINNRDRASLDYLPRKAPGEIGFSVLRNIRGLRKQSDTRR